MSYSVVWRDYDNEYVESFNKWQDVLEWAESFMWLTSIEDYGIYIVGAFNGKNVTQWLANNKRLARYGVLLIHMRYVKKIEVGDVQL